MPIRTKRIIFAIVCRPLLFLIPFTYTMLHSAEVDVLIGTYTRDGKSRGIYSFKLNTDSGTCSTPRLAAEASNPSFLALHPDGKSVYAVGDFVPVTQPPSGALLAYRYDRTTGLLQQTSMQATGPAGAPCHIALDPKGHGAVVVNYGGGYVAALAFEADGTPKGASNRIAHTGAVGPHKKRQDKPHPHSTTFSPDGRYALVCDLGLDRVTLYPWNATTGSLDAARAAHFQVPAGAGARHSKFSNDGRHFYVLNELDATLCVFDWDSLNGTLSLRQTIETMPKDYTGPTNTAAEIRIHPNGRVLYATNRGHDSIAVFSVKAGSGELDLIERVPAGGQHPRNFNLSPDGRWLLCANRDSNNVVVFRVDSASGRLNPTGATVTVAQPVCVLFVP